MSAPVYAFCDAAMGRSTKFEGPCAHPRLVLATTILASSLAFVDSSVVNVGLPAIERSLATDASALQWIINAYLLPLSALLLLGGAAGDRFGRRRLLIAGATLFAVASLACANAPGVATLLVGRLLQGVGAAMLVPNSLAILGATFAGKAKGRAIGVWAAAGAVAGAIGPVLGGWLIDLGSWRLIFMLNLPLAAGAIPMAWRYVPRDRDDSDQALDLPGGLLATVGLGALTWALTKGSGESGWTKDANAAGVTACVLLVLFLIIERRRGDSAMMPLALFVSKSFIGLTLVTFLLYGALGALFVLVPFVLIQIGGYSAIAAGAALLPLPIVLSAASPLTGGIAGRIGPRLPIAIGSLVVAIGFVLGMRIGAAPSYLTEVLPALLLIALGLSGAVAPLTTAVLSSVDDRHTGAASGLNSAVARTGGLVATALLGSVLTAAGNQLVIAFHAAMIAGAATCAAATLSAFTLIGRDIAGAGARSAKK
jgi:EmrB/QacA subfamily drug resistance transporter